MAKISVIYRPIQSRRQCIMVRNYKKHKQNKLAKAARHSQPLRNMFAAPAPAPAPAPVPAPAPAPALAPAPAIAAEENTDQTTVDSIGNSVNGNGGGDNGDNNVNVDEVGVGSGGHSWPPHVLRLNQQIKDEIDSAVKMTGRGNARRPMGKYPPRWRGIVPVSEDPLSFFGDEVGRGRKLSYLDFSYPNFFVFYPEAQWPQFYKYGRPMCKWHNSYECCVCNGWMTDPRHAYALGTEVAVLGRKYECTVRREEGKTCHFRSIDEKVIERAPDYVKMQWRMKGFQFSHCGGIANNVVEMGKRCLIGGLSASGFQHVMLQSAKEKQLMSSIMYRSWAEEQTPNLIYSADDIKQLRRELPEYGSDDCPFKAPSVAYLISQLVRMLESSEKYKTKRMQMIDGLHVSGDHSFKILKCTHTRGKPFTALYCLLNEYGQVVGYWFTTGTSMNELEEPLRQLRHRYDTHGFDGPESAYTDRCCDERKWWRNFLGTFEDDTLANNSHLQPGDTMEIRIVSTPHEPKLARSTDMALILVGEISDYLMAQPEDQQLFIVDGEWEVGRSRMDVLTIGLQDGRTFIFQLTQMCRRGAAFPPSLKDLLEDSAVKKIGNRICSDKSKLVGWNVELAPTVELGHLSKARGLSPRKNPSIEFLCDRLFPGIVVEGKDSESTGPRISNWSSSSLTTEQLTYASVDGYITTMLYKEIMRHMDPRVDGKITSAEVEDGLPVTIYMRSWKKVADGTIRRALNRHYVVVEIDLAREETLYCKGAEVDIVQDDGSIEILQQRSINSLCSNLDSQESSIINIRWSLSFCRRKMTETAPIEVNTEMKEVLIEVNSNEEEELQEALANYEADEEDAVMEEEGGDDENENENINNDSDRSESDGENDRRTRLPSNQRRRLHYLRRERVKNDMVHIFLRFERVLSKEHGAYYSFMTALRDAMFILHDDDLEQCLRVLREKHKLSEEEIRNKMTHNFKWFLLRVRRLVPPPYVLAKRYMEVFNAHKDIICQKSGKKLFDTPAALSQHASTLKHIRRNCLSDIPYFTYYTPLSKDRDGLTRWRCHRGTSSNEGLHQKLRQLVRGFSVSPRFLKAIVSEYLLMWNQNIDVKTRGLPAKYYGLYDGELLEDEIEKLSAFLEEPAHPEWVSSKSLQCTGETFGIINPSQTTVQLVTDSDAEDSELERMAEAAADQLSDDEEDAGLEATIDMPPSSRWLSKLTGRNRATEKVRSQDEWEYFKDNIGKFQGRAASSGEADNYSGIRWSDFATSWNNWVDSLKHSKQTVTYKSASHLQDAYKSMKRSALQKATLRPHARAIRELHDSHTDRNTAASYLPSFPAAEAPSVAQPVAAAVDVETQEQAPDYDGDSDIADNEVAQKRTYNKQRCRKCGKPHAHQDWTKFHEVPTKVVNGRVLRDNSKKVHDHCTVPESLWEDNFPCLVGPLPRRKRSRKKKRPRNSS